MKVIITDCPWDDNSIERGILEPAGAEVVRAQCRTPEEVIRACSEADALLVGWAPLTRDVLRQLRRCRLAIRYGTGYDNIDVPAATAFGVAVAINPDYCVEEVATHALAMLLACHRQLPVLMHSVRSGQWDPAAVMRPSPNLRSQTVGIAGFGRIGRRLFELVRPLAGRVIVHDPVLERLAMNGPEEGIEWCSLETLLAQSDYISIHVPLNEQTRHLFNADRLSLLKPGCYLINCARGPLIDESALVHALQKQQLAGAALDVFSQEPLPLDHPLRAFPNVILTPHAAWYSTEADYHLKANPAQAILKFFRGEPIPLLNQPARRSELSD
jgi:D-3-phosphoglycerate dehydrogenase